MATVATDSTSDQLSMTIDAGAALFVDKVLTMVCQEMASFLRAKGSHDIQAVLSLPEDFNQDNADLDNCPYILLSMKVPWIKTTNQVYLVNYNSGNEYKMEKKLQYCNSYLPPESYPQKSYPYRPLAVCPSVSYFCPICQLHIDYKVEGIICTFDFILKIDIKTLPGSGYKFSCGKFVIVKFYKGNKYEFAPEISYSVKKDCYCNQLNIGLYLLLCKKSPWSKVGHNYGAMQMTDLVYLVNYNSRNQEKIVKQLNYSELHPPNGPPTDCPSIPYSCLNCHHNIDFKLKEIICTFDFIFKIKYFFKP
ncbi:uncharacterized protein LOC111087455 [Limulus polyphemus]|uniref:Uncharacterized protein LOC111087455 n=1 Tax=Limulus polyphemus TaxID=6850 RepID=A0ABM1T1T3_LIMPO|nr:uncharacterized protein LOC111087455 [Limulus polyphemus]